MCITISTVVIVIFYFITSISKVNQFIFAVLLLQGIYLFSSIINMDSGIYWLKNLTFVAVTIAVVFFVDLAVRGNAINKTIRILHYWLAFCILVNFILERLYPGGLSNGTLPIHHFTFFLGYEDGIPPILYISLLISVFYSIYIKRRITLSVLFVWTANIFFPFPIERRTTATICLAVFAILLMIVYFFKQRVKLHHYLYFNYIFIILIVVMQLQGIFRYIIVELLHRDLTFTHRTRIWEGFFKSIAEKPIFGYGIINAEETYQVSNFTNSSSVHNIFIQILIWGGIAALVTFTIILFIAANSFERNKSKKSSSMVSIVIFLILFNWQMYVSSIFTMQSFWIAISFAYYIGSIETQLISLPDQKKLTK
jgi:O-antigen ligase